MKKKFLPLFSILLAALLAMTGCSSVATEDKGDISITLPSPPTRASSDISFTVSLCDITEKLILSENGKPGDTLVFEEITIGNYIIKIECFDDSGNKIGMGYSNCTVEAGKVANVKIKIRLSPVTPAPEPEPVPTPEDNQCTIFITISFKPFEEQISTAVELGSVTAEEGLLEYKWYVDGNPSFGNTGNIYTNENLVGKHIITLIAKTADGKIHSAANEVYFPYREEHVGKLLLINKTVVNDMYSAEGLPIIGLIYGVENPETEDNHAKVLGIEQCIFAIASIKQWIYSIPDLTPLVSTAVETAQGSGIYQNVTGGIADDASKVYELVSEEDPVILSNEKKYRGISWAHGYGKDFLYGTDLKEGWYLPGINELESIISFYSGTTDAIKEAFTLVNGDRGAPFAPSGRQYISSSMAGTRNEKGAPYFFGHEIGKGTVLLATEDTSNMMSIYYTAVSIRRFSVKE